MKPIRVLTPELELLAEIDDYEFLSFPLSWSGVGMFEIRINRHKNNVDKLILDNLIMLENESNKVGVIIQRDIGIDENGKQSEQWIIRGLALKGIVGYRATEPPLNIAYDSIQADAETVMKHYVTNNIISPVDLKRIIPLIQLATNQNRGDIVTWQSRYKNLADELAEISFISGLGWDVYLDFTQKKWIFEVYEGRDLTVNQSVNPPVIFSPDFESIKSQQFTESKLNYRNVGYVGGQGEGELREIAIVGDASGLDRIETFIDARDVEDSSQLAVRGQQKMMEFDTEIYLEAEILTPIKRVEYTTENHFISPYQSMETKERKEHLISTFIYEKDYKLGDIVTIQNRGWSVTKNARITEFKEIYDSSGFKLEATFGQSRPTVMSKLKQQFSQLEKEVKR